MIHTEAEVIIVTLRLALRRRPANCWSSCSLFSEIPPAEFRHIDRLLTVIDVQAGYVLGRQGEVCREFMVVLDGELAVMHDDVPIAVLPAASHIGAAPLMNPDHPYRLVSCHALGPVRLGVATPREFRTLLAEAPTLSRRITNLAQRRQAYFDGMTDAQQAQPQHLDRQNFPVVATLV